MNNNWRFPASGGGERKGISSGDVETFKKAPYKSFAREILQNSIDARDSDESAVRVEFQEFYINKASIPGVEEYINQVKRCMEFWAHKPDYVKEYQRILEYLECDNVQCLRISDYNTTGLLGVESKEMKGNKFLALTKGTGVSEKNSGVAAGSKGVGKNAAFILSNLKMVFYSTLTNDDNVGGLGVAELISGYIKENAGMDNRDYTQGTGYFGYDEFNSAIPTAITLDSNYSRNHPGTDVFIVGFKKADNWEKEVINSLLDSFLAAIVRGELEIVFNGNEINKNNIENIVYSDLISKNNKSNIISQYLLLMGGEGVNVFDIETEYGTAQLYVLVLPKDLEEYSTHECVMIRHPLMKIKSFPLNQSFKVSAMCIINSDQLGLELRDIENPQHTDWETKRIEDKAHRKEIENVIKEIRNQINERILECLQIGDANPLDPNGAGDYLPDEDLGNQSMDNKETDTSDTVTIGRKKIAKVYERNANQEKDDGQGLEPDIGSADDSIDGDVIHPNGENDKKGNGRHPGNESSDSKEGDTVIFKRSKLAGVRYKFICIDKHAGMHRIIFVAPIDFEKCYLCISCLDDSNNKTPVMINKMNCNGVEIVSNDLYEYGPFAIKTNEKVTLEITTDKKGYFASEVKVVCK